MIPQSVKDILGSGDTGLFQTIATVLFILLFIGIVAYVFSRPKKYYNKEAEAPLDDDTEENLKN